MAQSAVLTPSLAKSGDAFSRLTVTILNPAETSRAFEEGRKAYIVGDYSNAVKLYTQALDSLQSDLFSVIAVHRAVAYEMMRKYDSAIHDCQSANPNLDTPCPDVYFTQSNTFILQDKLRDALLVYDRAKKCVPENCSEYQELDRRQHELHEEINRKNIRITQDLPTELISKIVTYLPIGSRIELALTCRYWHKYMLQECNEMWSTIDVTTSDISVLSRMHRQILQAAMRAQVRAIKLDMSFMTDKDLGSASDEGSNGDEADSSKWTASTIVQRNWNNIRSLDVENPKGTPFRSILEATKETLESLEVHTRHYFTDYRTEALVDAVRICPNLRSVTNDITGFLQQSDFVCVLSVLPSSNVHLTRLALLSPSDPDTLCRLFESSPYLVSLALNSTYYPKHHASILYSIYEHCQALQSLSYKEDYNEMLTTVYSRPSQTEHPRNYLKLMEIQVRESDDGQAANVKQALEMIVQKSCGTLETLKVDTKSVGIDWILQQHKGIPRLRTLDLEVPSQFNTLENFHQFLGGCQSLKKATLRGSYFWDSRILINLRNSPLQHLTITINEFDDTPVREPGDIVATAMESFVTNAPNLKSFALGYRQSLGLPGGTLTKLMKAIASNPNIRELNLLSTIPVSNSELISMVTCLKDSQIRKLRMELAGRTGAKILKALGILSNLEYLHIHFPNRRRVDKELLRKLFSTCQSTRFLVVKLSNVLGHQLVESRQPTVAGDIQA